MTQIARETVKIVMRLPQDRVRALLEYARYLADKVDEEAWQERFGSRKYAPKLKEMADRALKDHRTGKTRILIRRSI